MTSVPPRRAGLQSPDPTIASCSPASGIRPGLRFMVTWHIGTEELVAMFPTLCLR